METNGITYDATQPVVKRDIDDISGIDALRSAWAGRRSGFEALYRERGEISNETDAKVANDLAEQLRAPITASVVQRFRREIDLVRFERPSRVDPSANIGGASVVWQPPPNTAALVLPHDAEVRCAEAAIKGLCARYSISLDADRPEPVFVRKVANIGRLAAAIAIEAVAALREARS
jgi:hypothetical protein